MKTQSVGNVNFVKIESSLRNKKVIWCEYIVIKFGKVEIPNFRPHSNHFSTNNNMIILMKIVKRTQGNWNNV